MFGTGVGDEDVPSLGHNVLQRGRSYYPGTLLTALQRAYAAQVAIMYHTPVRHSVQLRLLWRCALPGMQTTP